MAVRAVVFDIGGVLEIAPSLGVPQRWAAVFGLRPEEFEERTDSIWQAGAIGLITEEEVHNRLRELVGVDAALVEAFMNDIWVEYLGTLNVELTEYFRGLRPAYKTGIISNSFVGAREREQELYGLGDITDDIVYSHETGMSKPDPRIYLLACERLGVSPEETVFLDDSEAMVDGARAVGIQAILFQDNAQAIADINACLS